MVDLTKQNKDLTSQPGGLRKNLSVTKSERVKKQEHASIDAPPQNKQTNKQTHTPEVRDVSETSVNVDISNTFSVLSGIEDV